MSQQINLYSPIFRRQEKKFSARAMLQAGAVIAAGIGLIAGLGVWQTFSLRADLRAAEEQSAKALKQLEETNRQLKPRAGDKRLEEEVAKFETILAVSSQAQQELRRDIFGDSRGYSTYFIALARQSLPDMWLTGIDITGAGESVELNGRTTVPERVPQYLQHLSSEKVLSGTEFKVFRLERPALELKTATGRPDPNKKPVLAEYVEFSIHTTSAAGTAAGARRP